MPETMPALFIGHGSPMTVISDVPERRALQELGQRLPRPKAILAVSAHWETQGKTHLTDGAHPRTIHDFRGFPQELYDIQYTAPGSDWLAGRIESVLGRDRIARDEAWGFDHGAWGVVQSMFPEADIPMVEMSLDRALTPAGHLALGRALAPLRREGVLIVGSGNVVHNLAHWRELAGTRPAWAEDFRARINAALLAGDDHVLTELSPEDHAASLAVNSGEHYLPLLYAAGARLPGDGVTLFNDRLDGALTMTSVLYGDADLLAGIS